MYYKIVTADLRSAWLSECNLYDLAIQYKINEWVEPYPNSSLMVFENLFYAKEYLQNVLLYHDDIRFYRIYTCNIIKSKDKKVVFSDPKILREYLELLKTNKNKAFEYYLQHKDTPIEGTVFCDAVKLKEKV